MYTVVHDRWMSAKHRSVDAALDRNGKLLWIQRKPDQSWQEGLGLETKSWDE